MTNNSFRMDKFQIFVCVDQYILNRTGHLWSNIQEPAATGNEPRNKQTEQTKPRFFSSLNSSANINISNQRYGPLLIDVTIFGTKYCLQNYK